MATEKQDSAQDCQQKSDSDRESEVAMVSYELVGYLITISLSRLLSCFSIDNLKHYLAFPNNLRITPESYTPS